MYKGAKVTEGTDLSVGVSVPGTEGAASLTVMNYLSGFRLGVAENARAALRYVVAETNCYLGCIATRVTKTVEAEIEPRENIVRTGNAGAGTEGR